MAGPRRTGKLSAGGRRGAGSDGRNESRCVILGERTEGRPTVPVAVREKVRAVSADVGGQAKLARILGVSPSRVSRWLRTEEPDPENRRKVEGVEYVLSRLMALYEPDTALKWLQGLNAYSGNRRPIDLLGQGRIDEVLVAIQAEEGLAYA